MNNERGKVIHLHRRMPAAALDALNRLTGLRFSHWPESLVERAAEPVPESAGARVEQAVG
ncbi:hypothetical protein [Pseudomonas oligotrophica]|uniref:hypothetical protein n=1 Tax=Pseudomonas oligotrophica TaxID=2912055 RepID=UPI001F1B4664|nr:hypothetical protein [Pseudomonas oligotrophica]MCF7203205.1 hypothetical protein [Pseudomonas oligotrophica]